MNKIDQDNYFKVKVSFLDIPDLNCVDKIVLLSLKETSYIDMNKVKRAKLVHMSVSTFKRSLERLENLGYLKIERMRSKPSKYYLTEKSFMFFD